MIAALKGETKCLVWAAFKTCLVTARNIKTTQAFESFFPPKSAPHDNKWNFGGKFLFKLRQQIQINTIIVQCTVLAIFTRHFLSYRIGWIKNKSYKLQKKKFFTQTRHHRFIISISFLVQTQIHKPFLKLRNNTSHSKSLINKQKKGQKITDFKPNNFYNL